jgi:hypothetical protein
VEGGRRGWRECGRHGKGWRREGKEGVRKALTGKEEGVE